MAKDYSKELRKVKPFAKYTQAALVREAEEILSQLPKTFKEAQMDSFMEPLSYIWYQLRRPHRSKLNKALNSHASRLQAIRWLPEVKALIEKEKFKKTERRSGHVYFILLDATEYKNAKSACGIYIGQSMYTPERRFENHKAGNHASRIVEKKGKFILKSLSYHFCPISRGEAIRLETEILKLLRSANLEYLPEKIIKGN